MDDDNENDDDDDDELRSVCDEWGLGVVLDGEEMASDKGDIGVGDDDGNEAKAEDKVVEVGGTAAVEVGKTDEEVAVVIVVLEVAVDDESDATRRRFGGLSGLALSQSREVDS